MIEEIGKNFDEFVLSILKWMAIASFMILEVVVILTLMQKQEPMETLTYETPAVQAIDEDIWDDNKQELADMFSLMR